MIVSRKMSCLLKKLTETKVYFNVIVLVNYWAWATHSHQLNSVNVKEFKIL